ncbi:hypothetical protein EJ08DRAFT_672820 [Tothia fuscella]|uniref:Conserved oligomeric Golgi complex subunit 2 n=1 Tax=Tothia fuscella TaxID=1048955 RepID=A0A9P4NHU8_9PEZI|nr:hypothetical protein EJ08DRAFT_672820 [Tothia fuscella]
MSGFYLNTPSNHSSASLPSNDGTNSDAFNIDNLPYPQPLPRSAFLSPNFSAADYLSTLQNRHQTLSDLRAELRTRSQTLAKELLDLVNNEYQAFLTLGSDLRGGEEKVEEVRVGVLGFVKGVEGVRGVVGGKSGEVEALLEERQRIRGGKEVAKGLVEVHTRIGELEAKLSGGDDAGDSDEDELEEEEEDEGDEIMGVGRLKRLVRDYLGMRQLASSIGNEHPFLAKQESRITKIRDTILLDLGTSLKQAKAGRKQNPGALLALISLYGDMDSPSAAIKILKQSP